MLEMRSPLDGFRSPFGARRGGPSITLVTHGDSITSNDTAAGSNVYPNYLKTYIEARQGVSVTLVQRGVSSSSWDYDFSGAVPTLTDDALTEIDPYASDTAKLVLFAGSNGLKLGLNTPAQEFADFEVYLTARLSAGWVASNIYVLTMLPRESYNEANRTSYNDLLIAGAVTYGYNIVRIHDNLDFGEANDQGNTTYYSDLIHPTAATHQQIAETIYDSMYSTGWINTTWTPLDLGNLVLWLDANDAATITHTAGAVDAWADKSGAGLITAVVGATTTRPTYSATAFNSKPGITFDGTDDRLDVTGLSGFPQTVGYGAVVRFADLSSERTVFDFGATNGHISGVGAALYRQTALNSSGFSGSISAATFSDTVTAHVITGAAGRRRRRTIIDGTTKGTDQTAVSTDSTVTLLRVGRMLQSSFWPMNGTISEIVMSSTWEFTDINRQRLQNYLKAKWGTP